MKHVLPFVVAIMIAAGSASAALNPDNTHTYLYGDSYLGEDGLGDAAAVFGGVI